MKTLLAFYLIFLMSISAIGQNIAAFSGTSSPTAVAVPNMTATALSRSSALSNPGGTNFNSGNWTINNTINLNHYIEWSVTADAGYKINITKLQINYDIDPDDFLSQFLGGNGPKKIRIRTSLDGFTRDIHENDNVKNSGQSPVITEPLTSEVGGTITFRLYGYSASPGIFNLLNGTLDIEGGLGSVLGLSNTGIKIEGSVDPEGLLFSDGNWIPSAPDATTVNLNALVLNGTYTEAGNVQLKSLTVNPGAGVVIKNTGSITVTGDLITSNNVLLESSSTQYSSLIVNGSVTGTTKYQRHVNIGATPGSSKGNNDLISAPVTGEAFDIFRAANPNIVSNSTNTKFLFGPFNKSTGAYDTYSNTETAQLTAATGYRAATTDDSYLTFTGAVNTTVVTKPITHSGRYYKEWNLVGNPYPSYIKLSEFLDANNSQFSPLSTGIYGYDGDASDGWEIWNLATLLLNPEAKIAPGQGFLVASKQGGGTVTFTPGMRSAGTTDDFIAGRGTSNNNVGFLKLNINNGNSQYHTDIYFTEHSTKGLDLGYDASIYGGTAPSFSIYSKLIEGNEGVDMAIQSLAYADLQNDVIIPLGLKASAGQELTVSIAESILPDGTEVYLEDKLTNTFTTLSTSNYTFTLNSNLTSPGRFFLHFTNTTLSNNSNELDDLHILTNNTVRTLVVKGLLKAKTVANIYDMQARLVTSAQLDVNSTNNQVDMSNFSSGIYVVELKSSVSTKTQKVILK